MSAASDNAPVLVQSLGEARSVRVLRIAVSALSWGALAAFALLSIGGPLIGSGIFLGTDVFSILAPWTSSFATTTPITNGMIGDTIDTVTPQAWAVVEAAKHGVFAAWNPWVGGGTELGALPNSGVYSPLSIAWWVLPLDLAPGTTKLIEIAVSTLGMSLLLRRLGTPNAAWALGSLLFVSSGFMVSWTNWPQTRVAALIPLLFWALDRAATRRRLRDVVPIGLVLASMFLGGFPAVVGYALYAGGAYVIVRSLAADRSALRLLRAAGVSALGVVLGALLAACVLIPFAVNASSVLDFSVREQTADSHLAPTDLATTIIPQLVGVVATGQSWSDGSPVERLSYVGVVGVLLVLAALVLRPALRERRTVIWFFVAAAGLSAVFLFFGGPLLAAAQHLPIFSNNPIGRLRVMFGFFLAVLGALGLAAVGGRVLSGPATSETPTPTPAPSSFSRPVNWARRILIWGTVSIIAGVMVSTTWRALSLVPLEYWPAVRSGALIAAGIGAGAVAVLLLARFGRIPLLRLAALGLVPVLVAAPALALADMWWPVSASSTVYASTPALDYLGDHLDDERYVSVDQAGFPGANTVYQLRSADGHAYQTAEWKELLSAVDDDIFITPTYSSLPSADLPTSLASPILDRLGVRFALLGPTVQVPGEHREELAGGGSVVLDVDAPVRSGPRSGPVRAVSVMFDGAVPPLTATTLTTDIVDAVSGEVLASTSTWYPALQGSQQIAVMGEDIPAQVNWYAEFSIDRGVTALLAAGSDPAIPAVSTTVPLDDGLSIVHTGDATIIERASALARVRWASSAVVEVDPANRVALLADPALSGATVVLEHDDDAEQSDADGLRDPGGTSPITSIDDDGVSGRITVTMDSPESGWLVFDDSLRRPGWSAVVDGAAAPLLDAEHAGAAIAVSEGPHTVELVYQAPGLATGLLVSSGTLVALGLAVLGALVLTSLRRRARAAAPTRAANDQITGV